jgi:sec-independent protein translocase protein TatA
MFSGGLQPWHIAILAVIVILVFGSTKLPDAARGVGRSLRIFKSEIKGLHDEDDDDKTPGAASGGGTMEQREIPAPHVSPAPSTPAASGADQGGAAQSTETSGQRR